MISSSTRSTKGGVGGIAEGVRQRAASADNMRAALWSAGTTAMPAISTIMPSTRTYPISGFTINNAAVCQEGL